MFLKRKKNPFSFSSIFLFLSNYIKCTLGYKESGMITCDGCKCAAFNNIFFHYFAVYDAELKDKVGLMVWFEGLDVIQVPKHLS